MKGNEANQGNQDTNANDTKTFQHGKKKYTISYDEKTGNGIHKFDFELQQPFKAQTKVSKPTHDGQEKLMFSEEHNGFDGIGVSEEAIKWMRKVAENKEQQREQTPVWTFQGDFGEKTVKTENKEDAIEYFNNKYNADLTEEDIEKQEEPTEKEKNVEKTQQGEKEETKEETNQKICNAQGCGKRKNSQDSYCQFHQELRAEAQQTDRDRTPAHPTSRY